MGRLYYHDHRHKLEHRHTSYADDLREVSTKIYKFLSLSKFYKVMSENLSIFNCGGAWLNSAAK